jgi:hypothetical protein
MTDRLRPMRTGSGACRPGRRRAGAAGTRVLAAFLGLSLGLPGPGGTGLAAAAPAAGAGTCYYVDSARGDDGQTGTQPEAAWKSLARVNGVQFSPGDSILFRAGTRYVGELRPQGSGREGQPIRLGVYGSGDRPRIDGEGLATTTLSLHNVEYWNVQGLEITNTGAQRAPRNGVKVTLEDFGTAHGIGLRDLYVHDVNSTNVKADGGGSGIAWHNWGNRVPSRFDGLLIEGCHLLRTDRNGIAGGGYFERTRWYPSLHVVIRGNLIEDFGGDGIIASGSDGCLVERNVLRRGRQRAEDHAVGIWPFSSDNTVIQYNEVSGMRGVQDGQGFDSDYNCRNSLFQYNYSHDNEGGFLLVCNFAPNGSTTTFGNTGTTVRYNISQNDGTPNAGTLGHLISLQGPVRDVRIYNNVIYVPRSRSGLLMVNTWVTDQGPPENVLYANNIFLAEPGTTVGWVNGGSRNVSFSSNLFYGNALQAQPAAHGRVADPLLVEPGSGSDGFASLGGDRLKEGSPCRAAGQFIPDAGGRDFWGNPLPAAGAVKPSIGVHEPLQP